MEKKANHFGIITIATKQLLPRLKIEVSLNTVV